MKGLRARARVCVCVCVHTAPQVGDHVRIIHGPYTGEIGIVLQVNQDDDQCIIISDATRNEIKTFGR